jgi:DNA-binding transcriptional LysR family regulator
MKTMSLQAIALRYFLEVVRCGSVNEASTRLHVAASAVSRQIAKLESELQTPLFERRSTGMVPTAAGETLAAYARKSQLDVGQLVAELQEFHDLERGTVRLACTQGFAIDFLPDAIAEFRLNYEGLVFTLDVLAPNEVIRKVREGDCDLGMIFSLAPEVGVRVESTAPGQLFAMIPAKHPLAAQPHVALADLQPYPLALPGKETTARSLFDICAGVQDLSFNVVLESNYIAALYRFSTHQGGICLASTTNTRRDLAGSNLIAVPITDETLQTRRIELLSMANRTLPAAVAKFRDHLKALLVSSFEGA